VKALRITSWGGDLELAEVAKPTPGDGEVLIRVEACGIGLTVLNCIRGQLGNDPAYLPLTPGHELVGVVEAVGVGVSPRRIGERVAAYFYLICGECPNCLASQDSLCRNFRGNVGVAANGGYAEYSVLPSLNAIAVPEGVEPVPATAIPDAIATPVHVARRTAMAPGARVVVLAAGGGVGIHMVQVAQAYGAEVVALDIVPDKLSYLEREFGVVAIDSSDVDNVTLPSSWGGEADIVVDLYGRAPAQRWAIQRLAGNGTLVCLTTFRDEEFAVSSRELVRSQLSVIGSRYNSRYEQGLAASFVRSGRIRPVVSLEVGFDEVTSAHDLIRRGAVLGRAALVW
jgi:D-arabinose 1-dehydrogenase-like Zn-dependent alcohol dehydrogenase